MNITMIFGAQPLYKGAEYTLSHIDANQLIRAGVAIPVADHLAATAEHAIKDTSGEETRKASTQRKSPKK
jgi:hypothetical protein